MAMLFDVGIAVGLAGLMSYALIRVREMHVESFGPAEPADAADALLDLDFDFGCEAEPATVDFDGGDDADDS